MNFRIVFLLCLVCSVKGQSIADCQSRFTNYLNFRGSVTRQVKFEKESLFLVNTAGQKEFAVYADELNVLSQYFMHSTVKQQERLMAWKGLKHLNKQQADSLLKISADGAKSGEPTKDQILKGYRVALDPGHFSTSLKESAAEQKYLNFTYTNEKGEIDTILIFESLLSFQTVHIIKNRLLELGAEVMVTRNKADHTSFDCTYTEWMMQHKKRTLDSLVQNGSLSVTKYKQLLSCNAYNLFWDFFRDFDLANRAQKINAFLPDVSIIVHYNVDEKNAPWKKVSDKNFTMAFIGGAYTSDNLSKSEGKAHFIRQLISPQLERSEKLSALTVANFHQNLHIQIATSHDADYLKDNCVSTSSAGVFCRNLVLCRKINSPLVYGESLYQDNKQEAKALMQKDLLIFGIHSNKRIEQVAACYVDALVKYLTPSSK